MRSRRPARQRGYALLVMLIVLVMGSLYGVVSQLDAVQARYRQVQDTSGALELAKEALLGYAATYRDSHGGEVFGYLPCPDLDGDGSADTGVAGCNGADGQAVIGLLPYKELGLPDLRDSSGNCLWYAVAGGFKATSSTKPTPVNWDTQGQFQIQDVIGNVLLQPNDANGGAAAVVFAAGPALSGQNRTPGAGTPCGVPNLAVSTGAYRAYLDGIPGGANTPYSFPAAGNPVAIVQGNPVGAGAANNDAIAWITPREIFAKVIGRADFAAFVNAGINNTQGRLTNNLGSYPPAAGNLLPAGNPFTAGTSNYNFYANWKDNFRYLACSPAGSYCYSINGASCDGVLLFGGLPTQALNNTSWPRPTAKRDNGNYFESGASGGLDLLTTGASVQVAGAAQAYSAASPTADIVQCLTPRLTPITASQMFATTNPVVSGNGLVTPGGATLAVGATTTGANSGVLYGCSWYPTMLPFGSGLRVYFEYKVIQAGEGFTFALADADPTRNPSTSMCGAAGDALGYAGSNGATAPINYPKIALEVDLARSPARNDPATLPAMHFAFDYWGVGADPNDDVTHGAGDGIAEPTNPAVGTSGLRQPASSIANGTTVYVRLDIARSYNGGTGRGAYVLNAYIAKALSGSFPTSKLFCTQTDFMDVSNDLPTNCPWLQSNSFTSYLRYLADGITINDVAGSEAMRRIYLGFTTGQSVGNGQYIGIANFVAAPH